MNKAKRRPTRGGASNTSLAGERPKHSTTNADRNNIWLRRLVHHLVGLGPRATAEALLEVAGDDARLIEALDRRTRSDSDTIVLLGARDWLDITPRLVA